MDLYATFENNDVSSELAVRHEPAAQREHEVAVGEGDEFADLLAAVDEIDEETAAAMGGMLELLESTEVWPEAEALADGMNKAVKALEAETGRAYGTHWIVFENELVREGWPAHQELLAISSAQLRTHPVPVVRRAPGGHRRRSRSVRSRRGSPGRQADDDPEPDLDLVRAVAA